MRETSRSSVIRHVHLPGVHVDVGPVAAAAGCVKRLCLAHCHLSVLTTLVYLDPDAVDKGRGPLEGPEEQVLPI